VSGIETAVAEIISTLSNAGLKLDPLSEARLREIEGRSVRLEIEPPAAGSPLVITMIVRKACLNFDTEAVDPANAIVRGSLPELLAWFAGGTPASGNLSFEGDEILLAQLSQVFENYEPDLTEPLRRVLGEEAARNLVGAAEAAFAALRSTFQAFGHAAEDASHEYYLDNARLENTVAEAEKLQLRIDRLAARLAVLESAAADQSATSARR
jgi:ubiquinone biosynthesis protein UbiJ